MYDLESIYATTPDDYDSSWRIDYSEDQEIEQAWGGADVYEREEEG